MNHEQEQVALPTRLFERKGWMLDAVAKAGNALLDDLKRMPDRQHYGSGDVTVGDCTVMVSVRFKRYSA